MARWMAWGAVLLTGVPLGAVPLKAQDAAKAGDTRTGDTRAGEVRREAWKDGAIIRLRVPVSTDAKHVLTAVTFPETALAGVVAGWGENDLSLDPKKNILYVKLLRAAEGHLHVTGASGTRYVLYVAPVDAAGAYDAEVVVTRPAETPMATPKADAHRKPVASIALVRAMRLGRAPADGSVRKGDGREVLRTERFVATLAWRYEADDYAGWVLDLKNVSRDELHLDLSRYSARGLVLVGARELNVAPGACTKVYLVFWRDF